jgi:DNA polymerase kappa
MSKHSAYYRKEAERDAALRNKVQGILQQTIPQCEVQKIQKLVSERICKLEINRNLTRMWIHVDMDMFYAAVTIRDNPELKGKPVAIGGLSMVSTANYEARAFGVRSAMPGFIAKALCPNLIFIHPEFEKYEQVAQEIHQIFIKYDPNFDAIGLDEAALDVTEYVLERFGFDCVDVELFCNLGSQVAEEIRTEIFKSTNLTASAGIACNSMLAKICSDINKPNGQKVLPNSREEILYVLITLLILLY